MKVVTCKTSGYRVFPLKCRCAHITGQGSCSSKLAGLKLFHLGPWWDTVSSSQAHSASDMNFRSMMAIAMTMKSIIASIITTIITIFTFSLILAPQPNLDSGALVYPPGPPYIVTNLTKDMLLARFVCPPTGQTCIPWACPLILFSWVIYTRFCCRSLCVDR